MEHVRSLSLSLRAQCLIRRQVPKAELHMTIDRMLQLQTNDLLLVQDLPEILLRSISSRRSSKLTLTDFFSRAVNGIQRADMTTWVRSVYYIYSTRFDSCE
jgi:hypothetical protein